MISVRSQAENEKIAYSISEVAVRLGVSSGHIRNENQRGKLRFTKLGRRVVILTTELRRYLEDASDHIDEEQR